MTLALIVGYLTVRSGRSSSTLETLHTSVNETAKWLGLSSRYRLEEAAVRVTEDEIIRTLTELPPDLSTPDGARQREVLNEEFRAHYAAYSLSSGDFGPVHFSVYDTSNQLVVSTNEDSARTPLPEPWTSDLASAQFVTYRYSTSARRYEGIIVAPILDPKSEARLGYLSIVSGAGSQLRHAAGVDGEKSGSHDFHQFIFKNSSSEMFTLYFESGDRGSTGPASVIFKIDDRLAAAILESDSEGYGTLRARHYGLNGGDEGARIFDRNGGQEDVAAEDITRDDVLIAFKKIPGMESEGLSYLVAGRPASEVYSGLNRGAMLALLACVLFIAFLCVNAYRDVHNNIVRPISLLNEGAQIVRQGDFDLKLKIGTGDEIEELASSFNQMALELKRNIRQLEESEESYRSLVTSMRDGIYQTDQNGVITFLNPAGVKILGYPSADEALGQDAGSLIQGVLASEDSSEILEGGLSGERSRLWMRRWDGRQICAEVSHNRVLDDDAQLVGVEGTFRDVTRSVRLEEEARERSERISVINQIANAINSSLEAGRLYESLVAELRKLLDFDYAAVALLSESGDVFEGRQLWPDREVHPGHTFVLDGETSCSAWVAREERCLVVDDVRADHCQFAPQFPDEVQSCLCVPLYATGRIIGTLNLGNFSPGAYSVHDVEVSEQMAPHLAVAIRNAQMLVNLQISLEEVTRGRQKLHLANEELKTLDELKTNLLSNVSHELRTPLVSVMGYTDMMINGKAGPINNTQREFLGISLRNVEKLVTLIENLLDFSRLHRGDERLVFDTFDLLDCARTSIQVVQPVSDGREMEIELLAPDTPVLVEGDKGKIGQVFNNLLSNAVKFNGNGGTVTVEIRLGDGWVEVVVSDSGIGIPKEALEKVFTRFYQYDASSTRKYGGTGIGLSIAQDIVRLHGGTISAASELGKGSTFRFRLNLASFPKGGDTAPLQAEPEPEETHLLIQLVSQDRSLSVQMRNILATEGMDMIHASSAENAAALAKKHSPDCVIVDLNVMERMGPMLDTLVENTVTGALPIILLTNEDDVWEKYRSVAAARVRRSFRKSSLLSGIHHALSQAVDSGPPVGDKILCVDDDEEILAFMATCLSDEGFIVDCCGTGEEALVIAQSREYGLVLLDIAMPGMDGWETCKGIKATPELTGVKIYMVTAKPIDHNNAKLAESGADGFLLKPFRPEDLVQLVHGLEIRTMAHEA